MGQKELEGITKCILKHESEGRGRMEDIITTREKREHDLLGLLTASLLGHTPSLKVGEAEALGRRVN